MTIRRESSGELLREFLQDRDEPCPGCGYNLRGLQGAQCPECRQGIELGVRGPEKSFFAYVAGILPLAIGVGLFGFAMLISRPAPMSLRWIIFALFMSSLTFFVLLIVQTRSFLRLRAGTQSIIVLLLWAVELLKTLFFMAIIR